MIKCRGINQKDIDNINRHSTASYRKFVARFSHAASNYPTDNIPVDKRNPLGYNDGHD